MELASNIKTLRETKTFGALSEEELKIVALCLREHHFEANQVIFEEGKHGDSIYTVVEGHVELTSVARKQSFRALGPGEAFGEISLLTGKPYALTAVAITPVRLFSLERETLRELVDYYPNISLRLMQALAERLEETTKLLQMVWI